MFEIKDYGVSDWDTMINECHACNRHSLRREGLWVRWTDSPFIATHFWVCSKECAEMFILQRC